MYYFIYSSKQRYELGTILFPTLKMKKQTWRAVHKVKQQKQTFIPLPESEFQQKIKYILLLFWSKFWEREN